MGTRPLHSGPAGPQKQLKLITVKLLMLHQQRWMFLRFSDAQKLFLGLFLMYIQPLPHYWCNITLPCTGEDTFTYNSLRFIPSIPRGCIVVCAIREM